MLTRKCEHKAITFPLLPDLEAHKDVCATGWQDQLGHQLQVLPPFDSFWGELPQFFAWLEHPEQVEPHQHDEDGEAPGAQTCSSPT